MLSTSSQVLEWALAEIKKLAPKCYSERKYKDFSGEFRRFGIYADGAKPIDVGKEVTSDISAWLRKELMHAGWKPTEVGLVLTEVLQSDGSWKPE